MKASSEKLLSLCDTWLDTMSDLVITKAEFSLLEMDLIHLSKQEITDELMYRNFGSFYVDNKETMRSQEFIKELAVVASYRLKNLGVWYD